MTWERHAVSVVREFKEETVHRQGMSIFVRSPKFYNVSAPVISAMKSMAAQDKGFPVPRPKKRGRECALEKRIVHALGII